MIDIDVVNAAIEHARMEQHQSHVPAGLRGDARRIDVGAAGKIIDGANHIVGAQAHKRAANQVGTQAEQIKRPEQRRLHIVSARRRRTRRDGQDHVALSRESIEFRFVRARGRARPVNRVGNQQQNRGMPARREGTARSPSRRRPPAREERWGRTSRSSRSASNFVAPGLASAPVSSRITLRSRSNAIGAGARAQAAAALFVQREDGGAAGKAGRHLARGCHLEGIFWNIAISAIACARARCRRELRDGPHRQPGCRLRRKKLTMLPMMG